MKTQSILKKAGLFLACLGVTSFGFTAPVEEINLSGSGLGGHTSLQSAMDSVDDGGVINFIEAGTYVEPSFITVPGGKTFSVNNTSSGTVIHQNQPATGFYTCPPGTGNIDVTFNDYIIERNDGTGTAFDVDQGSTNTVDIEFNNMILRTTAPADGGEALKIDRDALTLTGIATFLPVNITANDTDFICARTSDDSKSAVRVQFSGWENLTLTINGGLVRSEAGSAFRTDAAGDNNSYTFNGVTFEAPDDRGLEFDDPHNNNDVTIEGCTITAERRAIYVDEDTDNNTWSVQRNTIDISSGSDDSSEARAFNWDYSSGSGNTLALHNNIIITQPDVDMDEQERCVYISAQTGNTIAVFHNTLSGGDTLTGGLGIQQNNGAVIDFSNNIFLNLIDPIGGSSNGVRTHNLSTTPDGSLGTNGIETSVGALNLDSNFAPQFPSTALAQGDPDPTIAAAAGNDRNGDPRPGPAGSNPDIGAVEVDSTVGATSTNDWMMFD
jgi:hypothetical protein